MSIFVLSACCLAGALSGSVRGFGCESRAVRWVAVRSRKTMWTCGMCRSEWRVWSETYHGALFIDLSSLDWYRWMTAVLDLEAHPQSSIPYVQLVWALFIDEKLFFPTIERNVFQWASLSREFWGQVACVSLPRGSSRLDVCQCEVRGI